MLTRIRRIVSKVTVAVIAVIFIVFAAGNRQSVTLSLFPLPYSISPPTFLLVLACLALGVVMGGVSVHFGLARSKKLFREEHKRVMALQNEIDVLQAQSREKPPVLSIKN